MQGDELKRFWLIEDNVPGDREHGADVGDASALLPHHHCLRPVQEQLRRRKLPRSQLVLQLGHLSILVSVQVR